MKKKFSCVGILLICLCFSQFVSSKEYTQHDFTLTDPTQDARNVLANVAPYLTATGNQMFCPGSSVKIVSSMTITDPDDVGIDAIYIQISSGYAMGQDLLTLTGSHPTIISNWNSNTGVLSLTGAAGQPTYTALIAAIEDIEFSSSAANPSGVRNFSISVGQANYLPSNGHYYLYVPNLGIRWTDAKIAAQNSTYYGLQGYLATITSAEEAQIAGEQTTGAGWIGGSDSDVEGSWKWMTGPEAGTLFWTGNFMGFTSNYAFWNNGEPNNSIPPGGTIDEDYAHITAPGVGIVGSWNDLPDTGSASGDYQPKGYIVEYGGMPGDPVLHIATSSTLTITSITSTTTAVRCGTGSVNLHAVSNTGVVNWYDVPTGGTIIATGNDLTTPNIAATTTFYAAANYNGCPDISRTPVVASVTPKPVLTITSPYYMCEETYTIIDVQTTSGLMFWYDSPTATTSIFLGTHFIVPNIHQNTVFYAEANYNNCLSDREPVFINVFSAPIVADETYELCEGDQIVLNAENPGMTYQWSSGETSQTILSNGLTDYNVVVTTAAPENCSKTKNFTISYHTMPVINDIDVQGLNASIITTQAGDFEYSLNGQDFQTSNIFTVAEGGNYMAYVRERNQCGADQKPFVVISYPGFFTPNGDGVNDSWSVKGANSFTTAEVTIFDRFGKLITVLNAANPFWNGTFNGKLLPASDYWFVAKIGDAFPETKGHFSLLR
jgi:gliding motility-associated-like protein